MSGFLSRLVARAALRGPQLQRRQPALFEPRAPAAGTAAMDDPWHAPQQDDRAEFVAPPRPPAARAAGQQPAPAPVKAMRESGAVGTEPAPAPRRVLDAAPASEQRAPVRVPARTERFDALPTPPAPELDARAPAPRPVAAGHRPVAALAPAPNPVRNALRPILHGPPVPPRRTPGPADESTTLVAAASAPRRSAAAAQASTIAQSVQLARAAAPRLDAAGKAGTSAPGKTVQITIGRVEVRAVAAPERAAARPAHGTPARLSLDDYLRERSRGPR